MAQEGFLMEVNKRKLMAALVFPLVCLAALAVYKGIKVSTGQRVTIPVKGFDPRDLLSGHYLVYRLDLDTGNACSKKSRPRELLVCLNRKPDGSLSSRPLGGMFIDRYRDKCDVILRGKCRHREFVAGVEKFFIPEVHAGKLDVVVRKGKGKVVLSVDYQGRASVVDLLINDRPWRDYVRVKP